MPGLPAACVSGRMSLPHVGKNSGQGRAALSTPAPIGEWVVTAAEHQSPIAWSCGGASALFGVSRPDDRCEERKMAVRGTFPALRSLAPIADFSYFARLYTWSDGTPRVVPIWFHGGAQSWSARRDTQNDRANTGDPVAQLAQ